MALAFYAPMKSPNHTVPSGDRTIARGLLKALEYTGATVTLASTLQTRDGRGDAAVQEQLFGAAKAEILRLIPIGKAAKWRAWISYHNYYKAPDLLGPSVAAALDIPYIQIESTRARKRLGGPWAAFAQAAEDAADAADVIHYFTAHDAHALKRDAPSHQTLIHLCPFVAQEPGKNPYTPDGPILSVGMMRPRDKLPSYQIIAETLSLLPENNWHIQFAGDGPARPDIETLMRPFGNKVTFLGQCSEQSLQTAYQNASVFFWPGVNEAFGMSYIEAQAAGLPIIAQDRPGVRDVLPPGKYPDPVNGAEALSLMLAPLLSDGQLRQRASHISIENATQRHMLPSAAKTLSQSLSAIGVTL